MDDRYWLCPPCWRLVPAEVRQVVRQSFRDFSAAQTTANAQAAIDNRNEALRVLAAIKAGVPA